MDSHDAHTGAPVYSLYGKTRKPSVAMLRRLDALVFDIQDVGRAVLHLYLNHGPGNAGGGARRRPFRRARPAQSPGRRLCVGLCPARCQRSFIGQYRIPIAHGMTVGELALMIKGEGLLPGLETLELEVVPMTGWKRSMRWPDTGLAWVDPSPAIVDFATALAYAGTGLFEATATNYGRGTDEPFRLIGAPWIDGAGLARELGALKRPGVLFDRVRFTPRSGKAPALSRRSMRARTFQAVRLLITDPARYQPVETGIYLLCAFVARRRAWKCRRYRRQAVNGLPRWRAPASCCRCSSVACRCRCHHCRLAGRYARLQRTARALSALRLNRRRLTAGVEGIGERVADAVAGWSARCDRSSV